jgi:TM2 domain-containing membrane protein YozV
MKKAILSPLSSAFVIPGLGQIINQDLKKGVCLLAGTFILFIAALIKLYQMLCSAMEAGNISPSESVLITERFKAEDFSVLWYLLGAFALLWVYSVVDAHRAGRKIDAKQGDHS